ncbi:CBS domain-containing protein [Deinococcus sp.]|uniref:CBS domain-containing protein n=1 Tax=Deinococcus sp. TaxID=47478 RepID=UPI0025BB67BD|nr:CBS domain-containing protein [Deinococcus sp.]
MPEPRLVQDAMHRPAVTIGAHEPLSAAVVAMQELGVKRLPVVQDGRVVGIVTDGEVRRALPALSEGLSPWAFTDRVGRVRVGQTMRQPALTTTPGTPLTAAIRVMLDRRVGGLPVVDPDTDELLGMLTLTDVLRSEAHRPRLQWGSADQHMTRNVMTVGADDPLSDGVDRLHRARLRVLPVMDGTTLVGVLHETDVAAALDRAAGAQASTVLGTQLLVPEQKVRDLMRPPSGYLLEGTPMRDALTRMLETDVHGLPIIDSGGELLGVITISDVLRTLLGERPPA